VCCGVLAIGPLALVPRTGPVALAVTVIPLKQPMARASAYCCFGQGLQYRHFPIVLGLSDMPLRKCYPSPDRSLHWNYVSNSLLQLSPLG
jgi:hypothetical protein